MLGLPIESSRTMSTLKAFLVEDSPVIRESLVAALEELAPVQVVGTADDERGAVEWLGGPDDAAACDLMIVDIFLKAGSGLGVLRAARDLHRPMTMVVLSNYATADMQRRCLDLGASRVFDKSRELDELIGYCEQLAAAADAATEARGGRVTPA